MASLSQNTQNHGALGFALVEQGKLQLSLGYYEEGKHSLERGKTLDLTEVVWEILQSL